MGTFFTSDLHLYHRNVIQYCNRPFASIEQMHQAIIERWNSVVTDADTVYVLGDAFFCKPSKAREIFDRLNGARFILIQGNHDKGTKTQLLTIFDEVHSELLLELDLGAFLQLSHYPYAPTKWETLRHRLQHFWRFWRKKKYMELRYLDRRPKNMGHWLLHGHTHSKTRVRGRQIHVGVDAWNFTPVPMTEIEKILREH